MTLSGVGRGSPARRACFRACLVQPGVGPNSLRRWRDCAQTWPDDIPRLPFGSTRRTPTRRTAPTHPRQLRKWKLTGLTAWVAGLICTVASGLVQATLMQKGGCVGGCAGASRTPLRAVRSRRQGCGCVSPGVSGHWPDRASSAAASIRLRVTGTHGNAMGVAREAGTAPDTPAFLKNQKPSPTPARCSKPCKQFDRKYSKFGREVLTTLEPGAWALLTWASHGPTLKRYSRTLLRPAHARA